MKEKDEYQDSKEELRKKREELDEVLKESTKILAASSEKANNKLKNDLLEKIRTFLKIIQSLNSNEYTSKLEYVDLRILKSTNERIALQLGNIYKLDDLTEEWESDTSKNLQYLLQDFNELFEEGKLVREREVSVINSLEKPKQYLDINKLLHFLAEILRELDIYEKKIIVKSSIIKESETFEILSKEANKTLKDIKESKSILNNLIPDATAGSLSKMLQKNVKRINKYQGFYMFFIILIFIFLLVASIFTVDEYVKDFNKESDLFSFLILRIIIALPIFFILGFCIRNFNKEKKLGILYRHKETVGILLPAYMNQAKTDELKDEILKSGTEIIFGLPDNPEANIKKEGYNVGDVKSLIELSKTIKGV